MFDVAAVVVVVVGVLVASPLVSAARIVGDGWPGDDLVVDVVVGDGAFAAAAVVVVA